MSEYIAVKVAQLSENSGSSWSLQICSLVACGTTEG